MPFSAFTLLGFSCGIIIILRITLYMELQSVNLVGILFILCVLIQVKFHIISHHKLRNCNNSPNISSVCHLNMEQLTKSLTSLYNLYEANRKPNFVHENEAEYHSFYVLLHLSSIYQPKVHLYSHCSSKFSHS